MNVLVVLGHPRKDSYCGALAKEYIRGAKEAGTEVEILVLAEMEFDRDVVESSPQHQFLEEDLLKAKELILWADHLVFVYPTWWGNVPALLKAFLDRIIMPGFAFRELQFDTYDQLLSPRTAQLITTMDTPLFVYKLFNGAPGTKAMTISTLKFCGISPVRCLHLSPIKHSTQEKKEQWLRDVYQKGKDLEFGVLTSWEKTKRKIIPWIKAIRLQFYPMTFFAYSVGAFAAARLGYEFDIIVFLMGYIVLFLFEIVVVFNNEYHDKETDKLNDSYSTFSGGSRVLVDNLISDDEINKATKKLSFISIAVAGLTAYLSETSFFIAALLFAVVFFIAISYTAPPLKLSYKGLGEITVGFTHSFAMIVCGFVFQGGSVGSVYPWILGLPLFLSILPAIIMAGVPDYFADKQAGKGTLAVRLGKSRATYLAICFVVLSFLSTVILKESGYLEEAYGYVIYLVSIHALLLIKMLYSFAKKDIKPKRIDGIMALSLLYIMWFALIPFIRLM